MPDSQRFFADPALDVLLEMVLSLGGEVFVLKSQLQHVQQQLERHGLLTREEREDYQADPAMREWLAREREVFAARLLGPITAGERSRVDAGEVAPWNPTYPASASAGGPGERAG